MQKFTQKYTIAYLLEPMPDGTEYSWKDWPLHVTLADVFSIRWKIPKLTDALAGFLQARSPAISVALEDGFLGPKKQTHVVLLEKTDSLIKLHTALIDLLEKGNARFNNPEFLRQGFLPHSTLQRNNRLYKGEKIVFDSLSLIDMFPDDDPYRRRIIKTVRLGGSKTD